MTTQNGMSASESAELVDEGSARTLHRLMTGVLCAQLQSLGLFTASSLAGWKRQVNLPALYDRWLRESLRALQADGVVAVDDGQWRLVDPELADGAAAWAQWEAHQREWLSDPRWGAQARLVDVALRALPELLTGRQRATDVLFPNASTHLVEGIYKGNGLADPFNAVLADIVVAFVDARLRQDPRARVRILEIGAGTGGTSAGVLQGLDAYPGSVAEYCYTDLSRAFLVHAEDHYAPGRPYLRTAIFDVERPLAEQGLPAAQYDVVIAANVLHATKNIRVTLRNAKAALQGNGMLALNELSGRSLFTHLTFGLLEGWWLYEDESLRLSGTPGLTFEAWQRVLEEEGFHSVTCVAQGNGQQIVVAQSDGVIRQPARTVGTARAVASVASAASAGSTKASAAAAVSRNAAPAGAKSADAIGDDAVREHIHRTILDQLSSTLRMDRDAIDPDESFADYGLDSIMGVRATEAINKALSIKLTTTSVFDYPSTNKLAAHVFAEYRDVVHKQLADAESDGRQRRSVDAVTPEKAAARSRPSPSMPTSTALGASSGSSAAPAPAPAPEAASTSRAPSLRDPIAIIGMSARYARAENVEELWEHLARGTDLTEPVTRWDLAREYAAAKIDDGCLRGGLLQAIDRFDPLFFNISGVEAAHMDPQQRLFLEESWRALEDAGYAGASIEGRRCGVYVGCNGGDYQQLLQAESVPPEAMMGGAASILSARIAYCLDLKGPAMTIDTACSSSLVAMHLACQALRAGEVDLALAGGVYVQCTPTFYLMASRTGMLSPNGRCYTFDDRADGFVPGEGVGAVLLKRLSEAVADGDHVHAVIRGSAINQDGTTNGITAPSALSQERLEREVYENFGVRAEDIQMVEAHGTGTKLGDPIEYQALTRAFRQDTDKKHFCAIGSIKTNIGHTTAASGLAGVLKCVLALKYRRIPPSLHFERGNSHIDFDSSPFYVNTKLRDWETAPGVRRVAAVSSFGMSGTNAHMVLEEAPPSARAHAERPGYVIALSARTAAQLREHVEGLLRHCEANPGLDCGNVAYTLLVGRKHFEHRLACVAGSADELSSRLREWLGGGSAARLYGSASTRKTKEQESMQRFGNHCIENCRRYIPNGDSSRRDYLEDLSNVAELYAQGHRLSFDRLFADGGYARTPLPTYRFERRRCWVGAARTPDATRREPAAASAIEEVPAAQPTKSGASHEDSLTFAPLDERVPRFSLSRLALRPELYAVEERRALEELVAEKKRELRRVLFYKEDFARIRSVLDLGAGQGAELVELAQHFSHLRADGNTSASEHAEIGNGRIARLGLSDRARLFARSAGAEPFPGDYDLIVGIGVTSHARDRKALFRSVAASLTPTGRVLLADFVVNLRGPIVDQGVEITIPTAVDWGDALSGDGLRIDEVIDVSREIGNFVHDPELEESLRGQPKAMQDTFRNYANISTALERGWISYCLFKIDKVRGMSDEELRAHNASKMAAKRPYSDALREQLSLAIPTYPFSAETSAESAPPAVSAAARSETKSRAHAGSEVVKARIKAEFCRILRLEPADFTYDTEFQELGVSSINAIELVEAVNALFDLTLPSSVVFEFSSIRLLADYVARSLPAKPEAVFAMTPGAAATASSTAPVAREVPAGPGYAPTSSPAARARGNVAPDSGDVGIAIIGVAVRCSGARNQKELWELVRDGRECVDFVQDEGWRDVLARYRIDRLVRYGAMPDADCFDTSFFNISRREAESMDAVQRILLEECYAAIEDAGYAPASLGGRDVAVIIGAIQSMVVNSEPSHFAVTGNDNGILAARTSYFLNLKGPALALNTTCSSSLVAIDIACQKLKAGEVDMAIAGGITIFNHPAVFISMQRAGMLSPTVRCRPFDHQADGTLVGDGVGVVLLKRLSDAEADGDRIYGVIRASGTNQDGKTSGITVPSFLSQSKLVESVYRRGRIPVEDIQYIEAHGTGTKLGDPIEVHALSEAFAQFTDKKQFCGIGSIKANIGHTTAASGVLSLIKVCLSMQHGQMPPSINFDKPNPHIDFQNSPVYVNTELKPWPVNGRGSRLAAISSFGFSGTNAHLVVEQHAARRADRERRASLGPALVVLSAKNEERLRAQAEQLLAAIGEPGESALGDGDLFDLAFTLQVGRDAMECRVGFVVDSVPALREQLRRFVAGEESRAVRAKQQAGLDLTEEEQAVIAAECIAHGRWQRLLDLWVRGFDFDWRRIHGEVTPKRIALPTYPFVRDRYPVQIEAPRPEPDGAAADPGLLAGTVLHPLLHRNTSTFEAQRFSSTLSGAEGFLQDHVIGGHKVLPGVCYLEMARAAVMASSGDLAEEIYVRLESVVWVRPIVVDQPSAVHVRLTARDDGDIDFEIVTAGAGDDVVHAQGRAALIERGRGEAGEVDVEALLARREQTIAVDRLYEAFEAMGIAYGPAHRGVRSVGVGRDVDGGAYVVAEVTLPQGSVGTRELFVVHPSVLDSAFQASLGLVLAQRSAEGSANPTLPFALESIDILERSPERSYVYIRSRTDDGQTERSQVQKLDLEVCDAQGHVCLRLRGLTSRVMEARAGAAPADRNRLHPLVHHDVSTPEQREFSSAFSGAEWFLKEHGQLFPAPAYLEMARVAGETGSGVKVVGIRNALWVAPLVIQDRPCDVRVRFAAAKDGWAYTVETATTTGGDARRAIHAQGLLLLDGVADRPAPPPALDIEAIRARCRTAADAKARAATMQMAAYDHSRIESLVHSGKEALAALRLSKGDGGDYLLHPHVGNSILEPAVFFSLVQDGQRQWRFPYSLDALWIYSEIPERPYVYVRESAGAGNPRARKYDIDVVDERGRCAIALRGFMAVSASAPSADVVHAVPEWEERPLDPSQTGTQTEPPIFVLSAPDASLRRALEARWSGARVETLAEERADRATGIEERFLSVVRLLKGFMASKAPRPQPVVVLVEERDDDYVHAALGGLLKSARLEHPKLVCKLVRHAAKTDRARARLLDSLADELVSASADVELRLAGESMTRYVRGWREVTLPARALASDVVRPGSVLWIVGGLGGLGRIVARHFGAIEGVKILASGRAALQGSARASLEALRGEGVDIDYLVCDVSDAEQVNEQVTRIQRDHGRLTGIFHCAGATRDAYLVNKTADEVHAVLRPKVAGVLAIDEATRDFPLEFLVLFSSLASGGNAGQADYAGANAFLDAFAHHRNGRVRRGERRGHTISVNWPLWRDGGMQIDAQMREIHERLTGFRALDNETGMRSLVGAMLDRPTQVMVAAGDVPKIRGVMFARAPAAPAKAHAQAASGRSANDGAPSAAKPAPGDPAGGDALLKRIVQELVGDVSALVRSDASQIDTQAELSRYGFDSVMFTEFANRLNQRYDLALMPTVFFECSTLALLGEHLVKNHEPELRAKWDTGRAVSAPKTAAPAAAEQARPSVEKVELARRAPRTSRRRSTDVASHDEPIAIVGMSGRFPGSASVRELWENVAANRDLISEVPADRWDWRQVYGDPKADPGKTRVKTGGFMADVDCFDPLFFGISPFEAQGMDPQQRLLIQAFWACIEDAGHRPGTLAGTSTGVFIGVTTADYKDLFHRQRVLGVSHSQGAYLFHFMAANRVSYLLNLHGPSEAIDTACSSSLVALHRAAGCLRSGECEAALVGGVNVMVTPDITVGASQAGMLSEDGRCKTFDRGADGYGRGEGVVALLLKPLGKAEADGDPIYGLIRGSAENHGGKATSATAPNPVAQQALLVAAYRNAGVDVRTVGYIETHGTGTVLGDPIEVNALKGAFAELCAGQGHTAPVEPHCGLGSLKTNIGHLEAAAGLAGVAKVLMMLRHGKIPGNLHLKEPNPYLQLEGSPFYLVRETRDWPEVRDAQGRAVPRRAGVSSFGVGGANAHVVLEAYVEPAREPARAPTQERPALLVLSAKTRERLTVQAEQLLTELSSGAYVDGDLTEVAYTLQIGREAMDHRLAFTATTLQQAREKLTAFVAARPAPGDVQELHCSDTRTGMPTLVTLTADAEFAETVDKWIQRGKYEKLLELWVKGLSVDWAVLHGGRRTRRMRLPTYPFAKERHWIESPVRAEPVGAVKAAVIHPLLQRNTSVLSEQRFSSELNGAEFFLADHVIKGEKLLPAVAYLEMARAAILESLAAGGGGIRLKDVVWQRPLVVTEPREVHVALSAREDGDVGFEVYTISDGDRLVHVQGLGSLSHEPTDAAVVDLQVLGSRYARPIDVEQCYALFEAMGIAFGPAHRSMVRMQVGTDSEGRRCVLAQVTIPDAVMPTAHSYVLHPSVLDGALQASIGLALGDGDAGASGPSLPFALEELEIVDRSPAVAVAVVRARAGTAAGPLQKLDIDICDEDGRVCVRVTGLTSRVLAGELGRAGNEARVTQTLLLRPQWERVGAEPQPEPLDGERWVCVDEAYRAHVSELQSRHADVRWEVLLRAREDGELGAEHLLAMSEQLLSRVRSILAAKPRRPTLVQVLVSEATGGGALRALGGLLRTARLENPSFYGQVIGLPPQATSRVLEQAIAENARRATQGDTEVRYVDGRREVSSLRPMPESASLGTSLPWKSGGVYLITGGAGALGRLFAREIAERVEDARLVLVGRSTLSDEQNAQLRALETSGRRTEVRYRTVDVTDPAAVNSCVDAIRAEHGHLDGVVHCAGLIRDSFVLKKSAEELRAVMAPKVLGAVNLDRATRACALDFMVLFSSGAGAIGNVGQSDYATANAFLDRFAAYRDESVRRGERRGRTLSIGWPLWADGGMGVDERAQALMREQGYDAIRTPAGIEAFYRAWRTAESQVMVVSGTTRRLQELRGVAAESAARAAEEPTKTPERAAHPDTSGGELHPRASQYLKRLLATTLKVPVERIETDAPLEKYGIDSIMALGLVNALEATFGSLPKTLMFEYQTIDALARYFIERHRDALLSELTNGRVASSSGPAAHARSSSTAESPSSGEPVRASRRPAATAREQRRDGAPSMGSLERAGDGALRPAIDVAIVGLSGRYPQAADVHEYWENLKAGRDCITEIPATRWDHSAYFDPEKGKVGKSYSKWGGFIDGVDEFDAVFFNISPRDAGFLDPQERLFLHCVYETLEDAGYTREALRQNRASGRAGDVGVFVGVMYEEYQLYGAQAQTLGAAYALGGNASSIANRVSYFCDFHGPSLAVDTMCSSSLTAIHLAVRSLQAGDCEVAIAGGVNVSVHPNKYLALSQAQFASSTGRCESFGRGGDGYVPGEGVGAVLLKPLARAEADGDHIYGVIKGTSINHGGKTNGYTVPNPVAQAQVIARALEASNVEPRAISYIEAHGTGTSLGDPIEIAGLTHAFARHTQDKQYCAIGSAKSNIGHLESAAGIAGLTKVLLQMKHRTLVPSLHSRQLNPHIDFASTPFRVQQVCEEWKRPVLEVDGRRREHPRIAGISSFGAGGANAHVIVEEYDAGSAQAAARADTALMVLSAKTEEQLGAQARHLLSHIEREQHADSDLASIAYTLQTGREAMDHRLAFTATSLDELREKLTAYVRGDARSGDIEGLFRGEAKKNKEALASLNADEDAAALVAAWLRKGKHGKLLELWVKGLAFDWEKLYGDRRPRRISLPTYPFAKERYWIPGLERRAAQDVAKPRAVAQRAERVVTKAWEPRSVSLTTAAPKGVVILCESETSGLARRLSERVAEQFPDARVYIVEGPASGDVDFSRCDGWIDLVGCGGTRTHDARWITTLQRWIEGGARQDRWALCVTRGLEAHENTTIALSGADRVGLYRMLSSEYTPLVSRHVDLDPTSDERARVEQIVSECGGPREEVEVCYRAGRRYLATHREIPSGAGALGTSSPFPRDHVLWVTGGTRGIGHVCARHFVREHGVKRVVLTGREPLPARAEWASLQSADTPVAEKIRAVLALEADGAQVVVLAVPLSDEAALRAAVQSVKQTLGPIGGVLHCAGLIDADRPALLRKTPATIEAVLEPKVAGLDHLLTCFADEPLRFFVTFSSVAAAAPALAVGQSDYAMANAYMDYVAYAYRDRLPITSIQWPSWSESGMGENRSPIYRGLGLFAHSDAEGLRWLDTLLAADHGPVVLPAAVDPARWRAEALLEPRARKVARAAPSAAPSVAEAARAPAAGEATSKAVQAWLVDLVARELRLDPRRIDVQTPLPDYGVDSVMLVQLVRPVAERVGAPIDPSVLFEHPTIEAFSGWLLGLHGEALSAGALLPDADTSGGEPSAPEAPSVAAVAVDPPALADGAARAALATEAPGAADIAVIGMSCRFPGASNLEQFWRLLAEGRSAIRRVPPQRWGHASSYCAGVLDDVTHFDPAFFRISPADARAMDPQALLALEESLALWYQAGYTPDDVKGRSIGVYLGARSQVVADLEALQEAQNLIMAVGANYLAANISRFFDLRGPSVVIDTACSSALVAMNMAVQALQAGEVESALVGGVSLLNGDGALRVFEQRGILSREPVMHLFDRRARGTVLGEGAGTVWLKRLDHALRDGDAVYAVIKGIAINNDGRTAGPAAPNPQAQRAVMERALAKSGKRAEDVGHIEVNGSGTEVTDLLELKAIESVYRPAGGEPCELGSMKPNIGHPLCAEGIASFIKAVLVLHHRQRVPFLSAEEPMLHYDVARSPFRFSRALSDAGDAPAVAAINSFADGGTNAHVIVEAWQDARPRAGVRRPGVAPILSKVDCRIRRPRPEPSAPVATDLVDVHLNGGGKPKTISRGHGFWKRLNGSST
ncbi:SDR family NAD(P)-dependent oxidoreductase [Sorangium sp. So ce1153]|uniref:SDR family NAD(P)-dependent oxidoreductase n=1 Tax=Sorangium sp. So ce1153 TaxID=3133333 RepID=UPI003F636149